MKYPNAYIEYLIQFHATRDYFECHELLEEYWKEQPQDPLSELWVACIQIAVAQYHERRRNYRGAQLMYQSALKKLAAQDSGQIGLEHERLAALLEARTAACKAEAEYVDLSLPIADQQLLVFCQQLAEARGLVWLQASSALAEDVIHRHARRDRSDVIAARAAALAQRQQAAENGKG